MLADIVLSFYIGAESRVDGVPFQSGYRYGGAGFQLVACARGCVSSRSLFTEVKYSNGAPVVQIGHGEAQTGIHTVQELAGVDLFRFGKGVARREDAGEL